MLSSLFPSPAGQGETAESVSPPRCQGQQLSCVEVTLELILFKTCCLIELDSSVGGYIVFFAHNVKIWIGWIIHVVQSWVLKWGEREDRLDRVLDMNSNAVKECLQVDILKKKLVMSPQACNDEKLNLVTSSSSYPSPTTMPQRFNLSFLSRTKVVVTVILEAEELSYYWK